MIGYTPDINDGKEWSEMDIADLKNQELGLKWQRGGHKRKSGPKWPFDRKPR